MKIWFFSLVYCSLFLGVCFPGYSQSHSDPHLVIDFEMEGSLSLFEFTDPSAWRRNDENGNGVLELFGSSDYQPEVRSPFNIGLIRNFKFGSFTLEADLKQTGREYGHRDMVIVFGMEDASNFYYVHIASAADHHAHNIFLVDDQPRRAIGSRTTSGISWGDNWNKIRIERDVEKGTILIYFNDFNQPIMEGLDSNFKSGYIGFGSFDDTGMIDNIRVWSDEIEVKKDVFPVTKKKE